MMRGCIGLWIAAVAAVHFLASFFIYPSALPQAASYAFSGSIPPESMESEAFWFLMFAPFLLLFGMMVFRAEREGSRTGWFVPAVFIATLAAMIVPMPETGIWLLIPPAIALLLREAKLARTAKT